MDKRNSIAFIFNLAAYNIVAKLLFLNNIIVFIIVLRLFFFNEIQIYFFLQINHPPALLFFAGGCCFAVIFQLAEFLIL